MKIRGLGKGGKRRMKKKVMFIILGIVLFVVVTIGVVFALFNKSKVPLTAEQFKSTMEEKGYVVTDATAQFSEYDYVKKIFVAEAANADYQVEFYELADESYAANFYANNKAIFESSKGNVSGETSVNMKNHSKYTLSSNDKYQVVSRIDNTVVFLNVDGSHKEAVKDLLKQLGY